MVRELWKNDFCTTHRLFTRLRMKVMRPSIQRPLQGEILFLLGTVDFKKYKVRGIHINRLRLHHHLQSKPAMGGSGPSGRITRHEGDRHEHLFYHHGRPDLIGKLKKDRNDERKDRSRGYNKSTLVIMDEVSYTPIDKEKCNLFFRFIANRCTVVVLNNWPNPIFDGQ